MRLVHFVIVSLASVAPALAGEPDKRALDGYERSGEKASCVDMTSTDITAVDENTFVFRVSPSRAYVNDAAGKCNGADSPFSLIEVNLFGSQICRGEIIKVVDKSSGMFRGSCRLGDFERLTKAPPADGSGS